MDITLIILLAFAAGYLLHGQNKERAELRRRLDAIPKRFEREVCNAYGWPMGEELQAILDELDWNQVRKDRMEWQRAGNRLDDMPPVVRSRAACPNTTRLLQRRGDEGITILGRPIEWVP